MKRIYPIAAFACAIGLGTWLAHGARGSLDPNTVEINIVALNDFHGHLETSKFAPAKGAGAAVAAGGIDALGAALQAWRKEDPGLLLIGAGDLVGASPALSNAWADEPSIVALNLLGLRASAVGNHELDHGLAELLRHQRGGCAASPKVAGACQIDRQYGGASFSYLAANIYDQATHRRVLPAYRVELVHGIKVGLIGAVLRDVGSTIQSENIAGLEFDDEAKAINQVLPELRAQGVGVFIAMIHQGGYTHARYDQQDCADLDGEITEVVTRLDPAIRVVVSGHTHNGYLCKVGGRMVTQAEADGHMLTRIRLQVNKVTSAVTGQHAENVLVQPGQYPPAPVVNAYLDRVRERSAASLLQPVAKLAYAAVKRAPVNSGESPLGDLVADSMLTAAQPLGAQIAFMNDGGLRRDLLTGKAQVSTVAQVRDVLPFGNRLVVMTLTGAQIRELLEQQWRGGAEARRGILQVSDGFSYSWDGSAPEGHRVSPGSIRLHGKPLDPSAAYRVVVNGYLAEGGDGYLMFTEGTQPAQAPVNDVDALLAYLRAQEKAGQPAGKQDAGERIKRSAGPAYSIDS